MTIPTYQTSNEQHRLIITSANINPSSVREILTNEFGYTVSAVCRNGAAVKISDGWAFVVSVEDAQLMSN